MQKSGGGHQMKKLKLISRQVIDNTMQIKQKRRNFKQVHKTQHRKLQTEQKVLHQGQHITCYLH